LAPLASQGVRRPNLLVELLTFRTCRTELEVNPLDIFMTVFLYYLWSHLRRQQSPAVVVVVRVLFIVLLAFSRSTTRPAEVVEALRTLNLSAP